MTSFLSHTEIQKRFDGEWVLVGEHESDQFLRVVRGEVLFHSKDRDEVYRKAIEIRPKRFAMLYTGTLPENTAMAL